MARYTSAYKSFLTRLGEVDKLRQLAFEKERQDPVVLRLEVSALCRGAIVLLSGHLEAFIKELGEVALDSLHTKKVLRTNISPQLYYHISKNFIDEMQDTSEPVKKAEKMFSFIQCDISYWSKNGHFPQPIEIDRFNKGFSNPKLIKIKKYFNRFGYSKYIGDLKTTMRADYQSTVNMVDHLVTMRNKIAHGDSEADKTPSEVKEMIVIIKKYCVATDSVFATWWKSNFCSIR